MSVSILSPLDGSGNVKVSGSTTIIGNPAVNINAPIAVAPNAAFLGVTTLPLATTLSGYVPNVVAIETIPTFVPPSTVFAPGFLAQAFSVAGANFVLAAGSYVVQYDFDLIVIENAASGSNYGLNATLVVALLPSGATQPTIVSSNPSVLTWVTAPKAPLILVLEQVTDRSVTGTAVTPAACKHYKAKGAIPAAMVATTYTVTANLFVATTSNTGGSMQGNLSVNVYR